EYKSEVNEALIDNEEASRASQLEEVSWDKVLKNTEVKKYPKGKVEEAQEQIKTQYTQMAKNYQLEFPEFLKQFFGGMTEEQFTEESKKVAEGAVKEQLAVDLIADVQKLTPSKKEYQDGYKKLAEDYGFKDVKALKEAAPEKELKKMITDKKVKNWVASNCRQIEPKADDKKTEDKKAE
ncbi:MAG: trigger factor, partial [Lachnospiraceae bacterium]